MTAFFKDIPKCRNEGVDSDNEFACRHYDQDETIMGKRLEEQLRFAVAYWYSFAWQGQDSFVGQTFGRPWFGDAMDLARLKADVADHALVRQARTAPSHGDNGDAATIRRRGPWNCLPRSRRNDSGS